MTRRRPRPAGPVGREEQDPLVAAVALMRRLRAVPAITGLVALIFWALPNCERVCAVSAAVCSATSPPAPPKPADAPHVDVRVYSGPRRLPPRDPAWGRLPEGLARGECPPTYFWDRHSEWCWTELATKPDSAGTCPRGYPAAIIEAAGVEPRCWAPYRDNRGEPRVLDGNLPALILPARDADESGEED